MYPPPSTPQYDRADVEYYSGVMAGAVGGYHVDQHGAPMKHEYQAYAYTQDVQHPIEFTNRTRVTAILLLVTNFLREETPCDHLFSKSLEMQRTESLN